MKPGPKRIAKDRASYARIKSDPEALAKLRARGRAYKKERYKNPEIKDRVKAASRASYAQNHGVPRWRAGLLLSSAKKRAKTQGLEFDLVLGDVLWPILLGKCQVTGFPFDLTNLKNGYRAHPFAPSIDRTDNSKGYTRNNIKIVCSIHNTAKNEWRADVFNLYVLAYAETLR